MLEKKIKEVMNKKNIKPVDIYKPLKINRVNFYKAIKTSNLKNKSLIKILNFLKLNLSVNIYSKNYDKKNRTIQ
jgi:predicted transcriptional regulator